MMEQHAKVTIDDTDDEDDVKQEVTETIEKFVQNRHVQTLKYLRHVIDENRHLRLHIEHLKRRHDHPIASPAIIDPIEPEENSITEIRTETPEVIPILIDSKKSLLQQTLENERIDRETNTDIDQSEAKYQALDDELINVRKQQNIIREEFQRELERVDVKNRQLEKEFQFTQQQLIVVQRSEKTKEWEIQNLTASLSDEKVANEALTIRVNKLEQTNRLLTRSLTELEEARLEVEPQLEEYKRIAQVMQAKVSNLEIQLTNQEKHFQTAEKEVKSVNEQLKLEGEKYQELHDDNEELRENVKYLEQQLQEKVQQEQEHLREKQANSNFKDFIQVKRTLQACQQENEQLKIQLKKLQIKLLNKTE